METILDKTQRPTAASILPVGSGSLAANRVERRRRAAKSLPLIGMAASILGAALFASAVMAEPPVRDSAEFETLHPGVYVGKEKAGLAGYFAFFKALQARGPIDVQALIHGTLPKDTPGVYPPFKVTEAMVRYDNRKYDPDNRVLNDAAYARSLGYKDIIAYPTFVAFDDFFLKVYPLDGRDTLLTADLNHNVTNYLPVYPGDTIHLVLNSGEVTDLTPEAGSTYRYSPSEYRGSIYNQRGEKVSDVIFRSLRSTHIYKPGMAPKVDHPSPIPGWEAPNWRQRPEHVYTDEDWAYIRNIWAHEKRQGAKPLYWEDVKVGDEPAWTADGPVLESVIPTVPYGMGTGGSRTLRHEIMDPAIFKTMVRRERDGNYRMPNRQDYVPPVPDQPAGTADGVGSASTSADLHKDNGQRGILLNYVGRDFAVRHLHNWMGDRGWISNLRWSIMDPRALAGVGKNVPRSPYSERFLDKVPKMQGKNVDAHGMTGDLAIVKSYVYDKFVRNGEFFVDVAWWVETIDGYIWEEGAATIRLPSRAAGAASQAQG